MSRGTGWKWTLVLALTPFLNGCTWLTDPETASRTSAWLIGPLLSVATMTSEDLSCVTAGVLAGRGVLPFAEAAFWCWLGIVVGDAGFYLLGRFMGERASKLPFLRSVLTRKRLEHGEQLFEKHGAWMLFSTRFLPGTRIPAYVGAGVVRFPMWKFTLFLALAGALWTPFLVGFSMHFGEAVLAWLGIYEKFAWLGLVSAILIAWAAVKLIVPMFTFEGRRLLLSRWHRITEWEFWPDWIVQTPIFFYVLRLGAKHRCLTAFTASNPAIPHGGLALASKHQILRGLCGQGESDPRVARFSLIPGTVSAAGKMALLDRFREKNGLDYPIVLKPDMGKNGQGVAIIRNEGAARDYLERCQDDLVAQQFVPGEEFAIFYYRFPGDEKGGILSIARKRLPMVTGTGRDNLEHLILHDPRGLRMAKFYLRQHEDHLENIPAEGARIYLSELGTHRRGAICHDARELRTGALCEALDEVSRQFEGFHIGRFDIRVPDAESLREGRDFKVLELDGVSSVAPHIYEPGYPLFEAWRDMARQWRLAFEIGKRNVEQGNHPTSATQFLRAARHHRRREWFEAPIQGL